MTKGLIADILRNQLHALHSFIGLHCEYLAELVVIKDVAPDADHAGEVIGAGVAAGQGSTRVADSVGGLQEVVPFAQQALIVVSASQAPLHFCAQVTETCGAVLVVAVGAGNALADTDAVPTSLNGRQAGQAGVERRVEVVG